MKREAMVTPRAEWSYNLVLGAVGSSLTPMLKRGFNVLEWRLHFPSKTCKERFGRTRVYKDR